MTAQTVVPFPPVSDDIIRHAFFDGFPGIRWLKDHAGCVIWVSENYEELTGIPAERALFHTATEIFGPEIGAELETLDQRARETGETVSIKATVPCGSVIRWKQWVTPLPGGMVLGSATSIF